MPRPQVDHASPPAVAARQCAAVGAPASAQNQGESSNGMEKTGHIGHLWRSEYGRGHTLRAAAAATAQDVAGEKVPARVSGRGSLDSYKWGPPSVGTQESDEDGDGAGWPTPAAPPWQGVAVPALSVDGPPSAGAAGEARDAPATFSGSRGGSVAPNDGDPPPGRAVLWGRAAGLLVVRAIESMGGGYPRSLATGVTTFKIDSWGRLIVSMFSALLIWIVPLLSAHRVGKYVYAEGHEHDDTVPVEVKSHNRDHCGVFQWASNGFGDIDSLEPNCHDHGEDGAPIVAGKFTTLPFPCGECNGKAMSIKLVVMIAGAGVMAGIMAHVCLSYIAARLCRFMRGPSPNQKCQARRDRWANTLVVYETRLPLLLWFFCVWLMILQVLNSLGAQGRSHFWLWNMTSLPGHEVHDIEEPWPAVEGFSDPFSLPSVAAGTAISATLAPLFVVAMCMRLSRDEPRWIETSVRWGILVTSLFDGLWTVRRVVNSCRTALAFEASNAPEPSICLWAADSLEREEEALVMCALYIVILWLMEQLVFYGVNYDPRRQQQASRPSPRISLQRLIGVGSIKPVLSLLICKSKKETVSSGDTIPRSSGPDLTTYKGSETRPRGSGGSSGGLDNDDRAVYASDLRSPQRERSPSTKAGGPLAESRTSDSNGEACSRRVARFPPLTTDLEGSGLSVHGKIYLALGFLVPFVIWTATVMAARERLTLMFPQDWVGEIRQLTLMKRGDIPYSVIEPPREHPCFGWGIISILAASAMTGSLRAASFVAMSARDAVIARLMAEKAGQSKLNGGDGELSRRSSMDSGEPLGGDSSDNDRPDSEPGELPVLPRREKGRAFIRNQARRLSRNGHGLLPSFADGGWRGLGGPGGRSWARLPAVGFDPTWSVLQARTGSTRGLGVSAVGGLEAPVSPGSVQSSSVGLWNLRGVMGLRRQQSGVLPIEIGAGVMGGAAIHSSGREKQQQYVCIYCSVTLENDGGGLPMSLVDSQLGASVTRLCQSFEVLIQRAKLTLHAAGMGDLCAAALVDAGGAAVMRAALVADDVTQVVATVNSWLKESTAGWHIKVSTAVGIGEAASISSATSGGSPTLFGLMCRVVRGVAVVTQGESASPDDPHAPRGFMALPEVVEALPEEVRPLFRIINCVKAVPGWGTDGNGPAAGMGVPPPAIPAQVRRQAAFSLPPGKLRGYFELFSADEQRAVIWGAGGVDGASDAAKRAEMSSPEPDGDASRS